jgi:transposase
VVSLENSAVIALTGYNPEKMNKDRLYKSALKLHSIKEKLDVHFLERTNELFDIQDKIILYNLTNTYFEGEKRNSKLAKFGRSKEMRSDCKILVLALVINIYGFIKHSSVHEGNFSDCKRIEEVIGSLNKVMGGDEKLVVVMDAGIATKENLQALIDKGCHYLCVSRVKLKNYIADTG